MLVGTTKANFRVLREMIGMSQEELAKMLNVTKITVIRWENEASQYNAPIKAWEYIEEVFEEYVENVNTLFSEIENNENESENNVVKIYYFSSQEMCDRIFSNNFPYQQANAIQRELAKKLIESGYDVVFEYPPLNSKPQQQEQENIEEVEEKQEN